VKSKKQQIIEEYQKDPSRSYRQIFNILKDKIENLTFNYTKRILSEYNRKKKTKKRQGISRLRER